MNNRHLIRAWARDEQRTQRQQTLERIATELAATNPHRDGECIYCHTPTGHTPNCTWQAAHEQTRP